MPGVTADQGPGQRAAPPAALRVVPLELVLGGQRSGKSRRAEALAEAWLAQDTAHGATFVATATAHDGDMHARIARHRADRARSLPNMGCIEEPLNLAGAMAASAAWADPRHMLVIDCLTLWLSNVMFPLQEGVNAAPNAANASQQEALQARTDAVLQALLRCAGPVVLVSNEIGLGVIPMGREVRAYVDALGRLNQHVAAASARVCLMVAGQALLVKGQA